MPAAKTSRKTVKVNARKPSPSQAPKICIDRRLRPEQVIPAGLRAMEVNPANTPMLPPRAGGSAPTRVRMAVEAHKRWPNGRTLRVRFLDGHPSVQERVRDIATRWSEHANINFHFDGHPTADIRISFRDAGSWSYIGTDALSIAQNQPTMNYGWLDEQTADEEYDRVVLHEFGHALGCVHEHQNPDVNIPWDRDAVYAYYMGPPNNWARDEVDSNLFQTYGRNSTNFSAFDRESIMLYPIPNEHTIGDYEVGWNGALSATDRTFMARQYPRQAPTLPTITVDGPAVKASIGAANEQDLYRFAVARPGLHTVETKGATDVVLTLFGPNSQHTWLAEDDDSGRGRNARISIALAPGDYYARVRHYSPRGTGAYTISARTNRP